MRKEISPLHGNRDNVVANYATQFQLLLFPITADRQCHQEQRNFSFYCLSGTAIMTKLSPVQADTGVVDVGVEARRPVAVERPASGTVFGEITVRSVFSTANPFVQLKRGGN